jgi:hypothetical protein
MENIKFEFYNDPMEKSRTGKTFLILGIILGSFSLIAIIYEIVTDQLSFKKDFNLFTNLFLATIFILQSLNVINPKKSLFLDFQKNLVAFRLKRGTEVITINYQDISNIDIKILQIDIRNKNGLMYSIPLGELEYQKVKRIKELFEEMKKEPI